MVKTARSAAIWIGIAFFLYVIGIFLPEGFDWREYFSIGRVHPIWTPWTKPILSFLNFPLIVAITILSIIIRGYRYNKSPLPTALAVLSLPTMWVLLMGNLDGLVLLGLILLPWGVPLALMKPQVSAFALLAKKTSFIAGAVFILITFFIWGLWPLRFLMALTPEWKAEWTQDISLFPWGVLIALPLLWFSRRDEDLLMAAGSFATPHLFPYHFILVMPALGRMNKFWMWFTWVISFTPLLANWVGPKGWHMGNVLGACLWLGIYFSKPSRKVSEFSAESSALAEKKTTGTQKELPE
jgi:hypothetical protein